jgi:hypothetical protein
VGVALGLIALLIVVALWVLLSRARTQTLPAPQALGVEVD